MSCNSTKCSLYVYEKPIDGIRNLDPSFFVQGHDRDAAGDETDVRDREHPDVQRTGASGDANFASKHASAFRCVCSYAKGQAFGFFFTNFGNENGSARCCQNIVGVNAVVAAIFFIKMCC